MEDKKWKEEWINIWKPLLLTDGKLDEQKIKKEMGDLTFMFEQMSEVYAYITNGRLSKPMYYASTIKTAFDDAVTKAVEDELKDRGLK